jgi:hypothetical protein
MPNSPSDIQGSYSAAVQAAERSVAALRDVWPIAIPSLAQPQDAAIREALRSIEDGWAALLRVQADFTD